MPGGWWWAVFFAALGLGSYGLGLWFCRAAAEVAGGAPWGP